MEQARAETHAHQSAEGGFEQFKVRRPETFLTRACCAGKGAFDRLEKAVWRGATLAPEASFADGPCQGLSAFYQPHHTCIAENEVARAIMRREDFDNTAKIAAVMGVDNHPKIACSARGFHNYLRRPISSVSPEHVGAKGMRRRL